MPTVQHEKSPGQRDESRTTIESDNSDQAYNCKAELHSHYQGPIRAICSEKHASPLFSSPISVISFLAYSAQGHSNMIAVGLPIRLDNGLQKGGRNPKPAFVGEAVSGGHKTAVLWVWDSGIFDAELARMGATVKCRSCCSSRRRSRIAGCFRFACANLNMQRSFFFRHARMDWLWKTLDVEKMLRGWAEPSTNGLH
jgi:hypothetical protein